jgi:hypothetical protein
MTQRRSKTLTPPHQISGALPGASRSRRGTPRRQIRRPCLRFDPRAYAKFLYFRDRGDTEVGAFGISERFDPLLIRDVVLVPQRCTVFSVRFDDTGVADFFDRQTELGRHPEEFSRLWLHSHPGASPFPSAIDEETFRRVFGDCHWSVMAIVSRTGAFYARLQFAAGIKASIRIPVEFDFTQPFQGTDFERWDEEYCANVIEEPLVPESDFDNPNIHECRGIAAPKESYLTQSQSLPIRGGGRL